METTYTHVAWGGRGASRRWRCPSGIRPCYLAYLAWSWLCWYAHDLGCVSTLTYVIVSGSHKACSEEDASAGERASTTGAESTAVEASSKGCGARARASGRWRFLRGLAQREKGTGMTIAFASHVTVNNCFCMCCVLSLCRKCGIQPGALCSPTGSSSGPKTSMTAGRHSASKHLHSICHHDGVPWSLFVVFFNRLQGILPQDSTPFPLQQGPCPSYRNCFLPTACNHLVQRHECIHLHIYHARILAGAQQWPEPLFSQPPRGDPRNNIFKYYIYIYVYIRICLFIRFLISSLSKLSYLKVV